MPITPINTQSKASIRTYVESTFYEAGEFFKATPHENTVKRARENGFISEKIRPVIILNYTDNSWNWGNRAGLIDLVIQIFKLFTPSSQTTSKEKTPKETEAEKKEQELKQAGIVGGVILLIGGYVSGCLYEPYVTCKETLENTKRVYQAVKGMKDDYAQATENPSIKKHLLSLVQCQLNIDTARAQRYTYYFMAATGTTLGAAALVGGYFLHIHALVRPGYFTILTSLFIAVVNAGAQHGKATTIRKNYELIAGTPGRNNGWAQEILAKILPHYNEQMADQRDIVNVDRDDVNYMDRPPLYQPFYQDRYNEGWNGPLRGPEPSAPGLFD